MNQPTTRTLTTPAPFNPISAGKPLKCQYRNPNRLAIQTEHKTFNHYADLICTGNVSSNAQASSYIRAFTDTQCNGFTFPEGHLREIDLSPFKKFMPHGFLKTVLESTNTSSAILYMFRSPDIKNKLYVIHGFVLTKTDRERYELIKVQSTGPTRKSDNVVDWASRFVATSNKNN